ncbi:hypothetical protein BD410DRAFT_779281 [Rickenella mellea]|uniref:Protein BIG1 n=1 Tax=Rickenella mellea TaxID=50990 RepID=A0A4R5XD92_9AGAM|nr:hypothetical protein BD410DRAFT_779281 [Rickenella mellea]
MKATQLAFAALLPFTWAFADTYPIISWSNHISSPSREHRWSPEDSPLDILLAKSDHICEYDAVVVVEHAGLHASDLRSMAPTSILSTRISRDVNSIQLPYVRRAPSKPVAELANSLSTRCGSHFVQSTAGQGGMEMEGSSKRVMFLTLPTISGEGSWRKKVMSDFESMLAHDIESIELAYPNHLFIYTGTPPSSHLKRQTLHPVEDGQLSTFAPSNSTLAEGGILKRYQLLTPALITSLLLVFFLIVPMIMVGINALASIQSPLRLDTPKGPSQDKKTQ